jgi:glucosylceramidase
VPREIRWITAETPAHVERIVVKPGAQVQADTVILELSNPEVQEQLASARAAVAATRADNAAKNFSTVVGVQWGFLSWSDRITTLGSALPTWATEHQGGNYPWNPSGFPAYQSIAPNDQAYGVETWGRIRDAIIKAKVTSYNAWNLVLDKYGWSIDTTREWAQNALLVADSGTLTITPAYYAFRHVSQYVTPGARVLGTTGGDALAFKNPDGSLVAVLFNSGPANDHYVVAIGGKLLQFAMPSKGWATLKLEP